MRDRTRRVGEDSSCVIHALSANVVANETRLACRRPYVLRLGSDDRWRTGSALPRPTASPRRGGHGLLGLLPSLLLGLGLGVLIDLGLGCHILFGGLRFRRCASAPAHWRAPRPSRRGLLGLWLGVLIDLGLGLEDNVGSLLLSRDILRRRLYLVRRS